MARNPFLVHTLLKLPCRVKPRYQLAFFVVLFAKGQLVSKGLVGILNSSKKRTKKFDLQCYDISGRLVFVRFLEELKTPKSPFILTDLY